MLHNLKCVPAYFQAVWVGDKTFEIRFNDRNFQERDEVQLQEYDPSNQEYTGRMVYGVIRYLTNFEQQKGWVVFAMEMIHREEN